MRHFSFLFLILLLGCPPIGARSLVLNILPGENLNPQLGGDHPTPVRIRIFPLRGQTRFNESSFDAIWADAKEALKPDLIEDAPIITRDITPRKKGLPEMMAMHRVDLDECYRRYRGRKGTYLGFVTQFTPPKGVHPDTKAWKGIVPLEECWDYVFLMDNYQVTRKEW